MAAQLKPQSEEIIHQAHVHPCVDTGHATVNHGQGFVLITVLVLLSLLTILSIGLYLMSMSTQQDSAVSVKSTQAGYYAETALSYMQWAWANDADFDANVAPPPDDKTIGDREEWLARTFDPGPTTIGGPNGAIMYFDNSPLSSRFVQLTSPPGVGPVMRNISVSLPRYVRVDIAANGAITTAIPAMPHANPPSHDPPVKDIPVNGAIVWFTAGSTTTPDVDYELDSTLVTCGGGPVPVGMNGCDNSAGAFVLYQVVGYAIGYVNSRPMVMIRSRIR